jgi:threonine dehydrogenase-like Zn-dependent dehydrogenase
MLLDVMGTSGHALERVRRWRSDVDTLLVAGAGPVGLGLVAVARLLLGGDARVLVSDVAPARLALAEQFGALPVDLTAGDLAAGLRRHGLAEVDAAVDASGRRSARQAAMAALGQRGVLVCVGHGEDVTLDVTRELIAPERAVAGSEYFRYDELPANLALLREHRAYFAPIVTHRFPAAEIGDAFRLFWGEGGAGAGRATAKVVVEQDGAA